VRDFLRHWLGVKDVPDPAPGSGTGPGLADVERGLHAVNRQLGELRGVLHQQGALTTEALHRAGWQSDEELAQQEALQRALRAVRSDTDVVVGPWTGEVGFELLYWIPFLTWLAGQGPGGRRMVVVSRGGAAPWYRHLTSRYVDVLELMSPDAFREATAGKKKQHDPRRALDLDLIRQARERFGLGDVPVVHPSAMFRLFMALWRKQATVELVESFAAYGPLTPPDPPVADVPANLPADYVVAKFYFSKAFPDTTANRAFVAETIGRVSRQVPVVVLSTTLRLDEHSDADAHPGSGVFVVDAHAQPHVNLEVQTGLIARSRGFIGTYGGFAYLAPFYGVPSLSYFSRRGGFESHHLELANRVFDRVLPGGFLAVDRAAAGLVDPAVDRWASRRGPVGAGTT
jgi:hypothetical protein